MSALQLLKARQPFSNSAYFIGEREPQVGRVFAALGAEPQDADVSSEEGTDG